MFLKSVFVCVCIFGTCVCISEKYVREYVCILEKCVCLYF